MNNWDMGLWTSLEAGKVDCQTNMFVNHVPHFIPLRSGLINDLNIFVVFPQGSKAWHLALSLYSPFFFST